jgi:hypothetical protein
MKNARFRGRPLLQPFGYFATEIRGETQLTEEMTQNPMIDAVIAGSEIETGREDEVLRDYFSSGIVLKARYPSLHFR